MTTFQFLLGNETYVILIAYSFVLTTFFSYKTKENTILELISMFIRVVDTKITFLSFLHKICYCASLYKKFSNNLFPPSKHNFEQTLSPPIFSLSTISELLIVCAHHDGLLYHNID